MFRLAAVLLATVATWGLARAAAAAGTGRPTASKRKRPTTRPRKRRPNPAFARIQDTPGLPRVLLIGDSISIGYTLPTRKLLAGKANVHRIPTNGGPTTRGLASLDAWLGKGTWDVIHFNWGLHDLKYMDAKGRLDPNGTQQVPVEPYEKNLRQLVRRLKRTKAKLIWCSTTPVPKGAQGRIPGDAARYNRVAAKVMKELGVPVNDLCAFARPRLKQIQRRANVHFTPEGSQALARQVANSILRALGRKPLPEPASRPRGAADKR
jgi:acyl-CoA thioesterase-1